MNQIERLKSAFDDERSQMEARVKMLQDELDEVSRSTQLQDRLMGHSEDQYKQIESHYQRKIETLQMEFTELQQAKQRVFFLNIFLW